MTFLSITARLSIERVFMAFGHMHASLLINAGVDVATVSADLGHTNSSTTVIISYGHTNQSSYILITERNIALHKNNVPFIFLQ